MELNAIIDASAATAEFKTDARRYLLTGHAPRIQLTTKVPSIKVRRLLAQLLSAEPALSVSRVQIEARAGCADLVGAIDVEATEAVRRFEFVWDCRWRAEQEGWTDCFGLPDQVRAARVFDWRCFRQWEERPQARFLRSER